MYRAIFVWPWNENPRKQQIQQTNGNRAIWLVYRTNTNVRGYWLVKQTLAWKNFMPENFLEINGSFTLTSYCNTIGQSNNAFSILGFSLAENEEFMFWSFHPLAYETDDEHLPKPFFKVIRKSLYFKKIMKVCFPCQLKVVLLIKSLAILCDSSFNWSPLN